MSVCGDEATTLQTETCYWYSKPRTESPTKSMLSWFIAVSDAIVASEAAVYCPDDGHLKISTAPRDSEFLESCFKPNGLQRRSSATARRLSIEANSKQAPGA